MLSLLLLASAHLFCQEPLEAEVLNGGFYKAGIRYGKLPSDSILIRWAHATDADTFWVYKTNLSLQYITNANMRTVWYNQPLKYERRMALHHLREYILESPLKFEHLENLSKKQGQQLLGKDLLELFTIKPKEPRQLVQP
jgi:hypothetical protein